MCKSILICHFQNLQQNHPIFLCSVHTRRLMAFILLTITPFYRILFLPLFAFPVSPDQVSDLFFSSSSSRSRSRKWMMFLYSPEFASATSPGWPFPQLPFTLPSLALPFALKAVVPIVPNLNAMSTISRLLSASCPASEDFVWGSHAVVQPSITKYPI